MKRLDTDSCAEPGCGEKREWDTRRSVYRSAYCAAHRQAQARAKRALTSPQAPDALTPGELLERWTSHPYGPSYGYEGRQVYGLRQLEDNAYRLILAGQNEYEYVDAAAILTRMP